MSDQRQYDDRPEDDGSLAFLIRECRQRKGLTQLAVAEALDITQPAVSAWEMGEAAPAMVSLIPLSELLEVDVALLLKRYGRKPAAAAL